PAKPVSITIQKAIEEDAQRLTGIALSAKRHWGYPEEWIALWTEGLTIGSAYILQNQVFTAICEGKVIAFTALVEREDSYEIEHLWVLPKYMGLEIGQKLVLYLKNILSTLDLTGMKVIVVSDPNAVGFYQKMGATIVGEYESTPNKRMLPILEFK
ncbi:MAG: GNAT family N-acetyltransferase, partial [Chitinophagales bacterium]